MRASWPESRRRLVFDIVPRPMWSARMAPVCAAPLACQQNLTTGHMACYLLLPTTHTTNYLPPSASPITIPLTAYTTLLRINMAPACPITARNRKATPSRWCGRSLAVSHASTLTTRPHGPGPRVSAPAESTTTGGSGGGGAAGGCECGCECECG